MSTLKRSMRGVRDCIGVCELPWSEYAEGQLKVHVEDSDKAFLIRFNNGLKVGSNNSVEPVSRLLIYASNGYLNDALCVSANLRGRKMRKWRNSVELQHIAPTSTRAIQYKGTARQLLDECNDSNAYDVVAHKGFDDFEIKTKDIRFATSRSEQQRMDEYEDQLNDEEDADENDCASEEDA